jgi:hypothetical protein
MASFGDLQPNFYYVVQEQEGAMLELVYVPLVTEKCVLVEYQDEDQRMVWYRKTDKLNEIVEKLTDKQAAIYESLFDGVVKPIHAPYDDDDDDFWEELDEDDDEDEDDFIRNIASKN